MQEQVFSEQQDVITTNDEVSTPRLNSQFDLANILTRYIRETQIYSRGIRQKQKNRSLNKRQKMSRKANRKSK